MQFYAILCKVESLHKKQRWTVASNVFVITNLTFKCENKNNAPSFYGSLTVRSGLILF